MKKQIRNLTMFFLQGKVPFIEYIEEVSNIKYNYHFEKDSLSNNNHLTIKSGKLFIIEDDLKDPEWVDIINHLKKGKNKVQLTKRHSWTALIFIRFEEITETIALTFGRTSGILKEEYIINNFGSEVSRQIVDSKDLNHVNIKSFDDRQTHIQKYSIKTLNEYHLIEPFKLNTIYNFLGSTYLDKFKVSIGGTDSLKIKGRFNLEEDLLELIHLISEAYVNESSEEPLFDVKENIMFINDPKVLAKLNGHFHNKLESIFNKSEVNGTSMQNLYINPMNNISQDEFIGYNFTSIKMATSSIISEDELDRIYIFDKIRLVLEYKDITSILNKLKNIKINLLSEDPTQNEVRTFYKSLYFEKTIDGTSFILSDGKWYALEPNYYELISKGIDGIDTTDVIDYISYNTSVYDTENDYNAELAKNNNILELDSTKYHPTPEVRSYAQISPQSNIEVSDLLNYDPLTQTLQFIHVKKLSGAASHIIHAFTQAKSSAQLFAFDKDNIIDFINTKRTDNGFRQIVFSDIKNIEIVISFIIPLNKKKNITPTRKLFTILERISLYETINTIYPLGFKLKLNFIDSNMAK